MTGQTGNNQTEAQDNLRSLPAGIVPEDEPQQTATAGNTCLGAIGKFHRRKDREPDLLEDLTDQARADHLRRHAAPEVQGGTAQLARDQRYRNQVARQVEDVAQVVAPPDGRDVFFENQLKMLRPQAI